MRSNPAAGLVLLLAAPASHAQLIGASFRAPDFQGPSALYDIDQTTGLATNGRDMNLDGLVGLSFFGNTLWGITDEFGSVNGSGVDTALVTVDIATGQSTIVGELGPVGGLLTSEGDIDFDPLTGRLYGVTSQLGESVLFEIDTAGVGTTVISNVDAGDLSGMAIDNSGNLWALDTSFVFDATRPGARLLRLDTGTGDVLQEIQTDTVLGTVAGMDFDPFTNQLYIADGDFAGTNNLYTVDFITGSLDLVGPTGLDGAPTGFGGLSSLTFVPAPGAAPLLAIALFVSGRRRR